MKDKSRKPETPKNEGNWTGRSFQYTAKDGKLIETQIDGFTFTAEQEKEIRRAFKNRFPEARVNAFLLALGGPLSKVANDRAEPKADLRAANDRAKRRAKRLAKLLSEAASEIAKMMKTKAELIAESGEVTETKARMLAEIAEMNEMERDHYDLAVSGDPVSLTDLAETLVKAASGFRKVDAALAGAKGHKFAGPDAPSLFVAAQAAGAWREIFTKPKPRADPDSPFKAVLDAILAAAALPALGRDATRSAIGTKDKKSDS